MYEEPVAKLAMAEAPTPGELVDRLHRLRRSKADWQSSGEQLNKEIEQAEAEIHRAITFLKEGIEGVAVQNGSSRLT